jgi:7-cyano-7-deazaguanine synthase
MQQSIVRDSNGRLKMILSDALARLPDAKGCVVVLSGGMDSTIALRLAVEKYGRENVKALTFSYGQKQSLEISRAQESCFALRVEHRVIDALFLGAIGKGFSANTDSEIEMPTIKEVLGDPTPKTYVPNRNMILMSIAAAFAETKGMEYIVCGLQVHDEYGYWDTTQRFVEKMNSVFSENRKIKIKLIAPFVDLSKKEEIEILREMDGHVELLTYTLTCYNPSPEGYSCGVCPSCSERIANFAMAGERDLIAYSVPIDWDKLIHHYKE